MIFKFVAVLCLFGCVAAGDYDYNGPSLASSFEGSGAGGNNNPHEESGDSAAMPFGYDYSRSPQSNLLDQPFEQHPIQQETYQQPASSQQQLIQKQQPQPNQQPLQPPHQKMPQQQSDPKQPQSLRLSLPEAHYPPAKYDYNYAVHDELTGDIKSHMESRDGDLVRGSYSLIDPDGYRRTVTYTADDKHGFHAVVKREPFFMKAATVANAVPVQSTPSAFHAVQPQQQAPSQQKQYEQQQQSQQGQPHQQLPLQEQHKPQVPQQQEMPLQQQPLPLPQAVPIQQQEVPLRQQVHLQQQQQQVLLQQKEVVEPHDSYSAAQAPNGVGPYA